MSGRDFETVAIGVSGAFLEQTRLVDRLCTALDAAGEGIGHENISTLLREIGPANERAIALLGGRHHLEKDSSR